MRHFYYSERVALLHRRRQPLLRSARARSTIDYRRLLKVVPREGSLVRATTTPPWSRIRNTRRSAADRLAGLTTLHHGHQADQGIHRCHGRRKIKGNMDIELAIDVLEMAEHLDQ